MSFSLLHSLSHTARRCLLPCLLAWVGLPATHLGADDYAEMLPRNPPTEPSKTSADFAVADGFQIQQIASEPLVNSPVEIQWAADGSLFVCEMRGYSENRDDRLSRISRLTDSDHDGVYDQSTIYAEDLYWPTGIFPYRDGLFVGDAPDLLYLKDTNGDGVADQRKVVLTGFSVSNVQGLLNSFRWGLDNRVHLACGTAGGKVRRPDQSESDAISVRGFDLALNPETLQFERVSGGGQHGMCFDDWGRKYVCSNSDHLQQVLYESRYVERNALLSPARVRRSIAADGPQAEVFRISPTEPWRLIRTRLRVAGVVGGPIEGGGRAAGYFTGATGVTLYRGDAWPRDVNDRSSLAVVGDVGGNLIHRKRITGPTFNRIGTRIDRESEWVASKDNWFRPAQFACGPDGTLTVVDVYREVIEHPKSLPPAIKRHLDLTAGRNRGRIYRIVPDGFKHRSTPDLTSHTTSQLTKLLEHPNAWHRETAARLIYERGDQSAIELLKTMAAESQSPLGRLHALYALRGLNALSADLILICLEDRHPQVLVHAVRLAEPFAGDSDVASKLEAHAGHSSPDVRYQLAWSMGELPDAPDPTRLVQILDQNPENPWLQTAVLSSSSQIRTALFAQLIESDHQLEHLPTLMALARQMDRGGNEADKVSVLNDLIRQANHPAMLPLLGLLGSDLLSADGGGQTMLALRDRTDQLTKQAIDLALNQELPASTRVRALGWLAVAADTNIVDPLIKLSRSDDQSKVVAAAIRTLSPIDSPKVIEMLIAGWPRWSPGIRRAAADALFANPSRVSALIAAIDAGEISADDLPRSRWESLSISRNGSVRKRAKDILESMTSVSRDGLIDDYLKKMPENGNATRGRELFVKHCAACHRSGDIGKTLGPSLAAAATRGRASITTSVLDPNREVNPQFENFVILKSDGQTLSGMIVDENANSITLRRDEGAQDTVLRRDLELIRGSGKSLMPEGLEKSIAPRDMSDLVEYLLSSHALNSAE